jgi:hypothetical protein
LRVDCSPVGGLERADALNDAHSEAFKSIDGEAASDDFWVGLPRLMITGQANRQSFKSSLACSHHSVGACDMPSATALSRAMSSMAGLKSIAVSWIPRG